ncbi:hypothetical protein [Nocardia sp. SSK8]|uniref:hypothetical protein n=1 Tax=Nocardia sp. SSK8 TaxID=3120154 RepID=UPI00300AF8BA
MNTVVLRAWWKPIRLPVILGVAYLVLSVVVSALSARHGFGSPDGLSPAFVLATATLVVLRIALLVVVPSVLISRAVMLTVDYFRRRSDARATTAAADA